jgi:hypothetical protein
MRTYHEHCDNETAKQHRTHLSAELCAVCYQARNAKGKFDDVIARHLPAWANKGDLYKATPPVALLHSSQYGFEFETI